MCRMQQEGKREQFIYCDDVNALVKGIFFFLPIRQIFFVSHPKCFGTNVTHCNIIFVSSFKFNACVAVCVCACAMHARSCFHPI